MMVSLYPTLTRSLPLFKIYAHVCVCMWVCVSVDAYGGQNWVLGPLELKSYVAVSHLM